MSSYDLTDNLSDSFEFKATLDGKLNEYSVKYPSQKEITPISRGYARLETLDEELKKVSSEQEEERKKIEDEAVKVTKEIAEAFEKLFTPKEGSLPVSELLDSLPINARRNFNNMIKKEFNVE